MIEPTDQLAHGTPSDFEPLIGHISMRDIRCHSSLRACQLSATWLIALTAMNLAFNGALRNTTLYALPVGIVAWQSTWLGFVFSGISALCAWLGGSIPSPLVVEPVWIEGLWAFFKLSVIAVGVNYVARRQHPSSSP